MVRSDGPDPTEQVQEEVPEVEPEAERKEASNVGAFSVDLWAVGRGASGRRVLR